MRIPPQDLFKGNLVDHTGMIKATLPIGKGDCTASAKPCGDLRDSGRISNQAGCCEHHIIVNIVTFQNSETSRTPWNVRECSSFCRKRYGWMLRYMNTKVGSFLPIPYPRENLLVLPHFQSFSHHSWSIPLLPITNFNSSNCRSFRNKYHFLHKSGSLESI